MDLKSILLGLVCGVLGTLTVTFYVMNDLKRQAFQDIVQEREIISTRYKPLFEALSADEQLKWLNSQPKTKENVLCRYNEEFCKNKLK
jgi:hypothetical protein